MNHPNYLVLTDFTEASTLALDHCYQLAQHTNADILSFHTVQYEDDVDWARQKIVQQAKGAALYNPALTLEPFATKSNLFSGVKSFLDEHKVSLTFMATHGKRDIQFLTGSDALKVIYKGEIPILVVQKGKDPQPYKTILMPVFGHYSELESHILPLFKIAQAYGAAVTLLHPKYPMGTLADKHLQETLDLLPRLFGQYGVSCEAKPSTVAPAKFAAAVLEEAHEVNADLIALSLGFESEEGPGYINKKFVQSLITNKDLIPTLCF